MQEIILEELLKAGVHFGHRTSRWNPKMAPYIFTSRNNVYIIDLEKTKEQLLKAMEHAKAIAENGGVILFVGTKPAAKNIIQEAAQSCGMPHVYEKWLGGTLTNFEIISQLFHQLKDLKQKKERGELSVYTKKEQLEFQRKIDQLTKKVGGICEMKKIPDALFILDVRKEKTAVAESKRMNIPTIAIVDTNVDPTDITYPIPGNDDATKSLRFIACAIVSAILEGKEKRKSQIESAPIA